MIDLAVYPLVFYRRDPETGLADRSRKFHGKRITSCDYILIDSQTMKKEPVNSGVIKKGYVSDKENKKARMKHVKGNTRKKSA